MSVRDIRLLGDPVLREECRPVEEVDDDVRRLVEDLTETMYEADGIGLAAPQVGVPLRIFAFDVRDPSEPSGHLLNPRVTETSEETAKETEGCLSIPGLQEVVERPVRAVVTGHTVDGDELRIEAEGLLARCLLHETDHLDGVLFIDRVSPIKRRMLVDRWKKMSEEERSSAVAM